jgi:hypothetical protein
MYKQFENSRTHYNPNQTKSSLFGDSVSPIFYNGERNEDLLESPTASTKSKDFHTKSRIRETHNYAIMQNSHTDDDSLQLDKVSPIKASQLDFTQSQIPGQYKNFNITHKKSHSSSQKSLPNDSDQDIPSLQDKSYKNIMKESSKQIDKINRMLEEHNFKKKINNNNNAFSQADREADVSSHFSVSRNISDNKNYKRAPPGSAFSLQSYNNVLIDSSKTGTANGGTEKVSNHEKKVSNFTDCLKSPTSAGTVQNVSKVSDPKVLDNSNSQLEPEEKLKPTSPKITSPKDSLQYQIEARQRLKEMQREMQYKQGYPEDKKLLNLVPMSNLTSPRGNSFNMERAAKFLNIYSKAANSPAPETPDNIYRSISQSHDNGIPTDRSGFAREKPKAGEYLLESSNNPVNSPNPNPSEREERDHDRSGSLSNRRKNLEVLKAITNSPKRFYLKIEKTAPSTTETSSHSSSQQQGRAENTSDQIDSSLEATKVQDRTNQTVPEKKSKASKNELKKYSSISPLKISPTEKKRLAIMQTNLKQIQDEKYLVTRNGKHRNDVYYQQDRRPMTKVVSKDKVAELKNYVQHITQVAEQRKIKANPFEDNLEEATQQHSNPITTRIQPEPQLIKSKIKSKSREQSVNKSYDAAKKGSRQNSSNKKNNMLSPRQPKASQFRKTMPTSDSKASYESLVNSVKMRQTCGDYIYTDAQVQPQTQAPAEIQAYEMPVQAAQPDYYSRAGNIPIYERSAIWLNAKNYKIEEMSHAQIANKYRECTFKPKTTVDYPAHLAAFVSPRGNSPQYRENARLAGVLSERQVYQPTSRNSSEKKRRYETYKQIHEARNTFRLTNQLMA